MRGMRLLRSFSSEVPKVASAALLLLAAYVLLTVGKSAVHPWFRATPEADKVEASSGALQQVRSARCISAGSRLCGVTTLPSSYHPGHVNARGRPAAVNIQAEPSGSAARARWETGAAATTCNHSCL